MGRSAPKHARQRPAGRLAAAAGTAAGSVAGRAAGSPAFLPVARQPADRAQPGSSAQPVLPVLPAGAAGPSRSGRTVAAASVLVAAGIAAVVLALLLDGLGTGARAVLLLSAAWALVVGGSALRRPRPPHGS